MFKASVIDLKGSWDYHHSLIEFSYIISTLHVFTWTFMRQYIGINIDLELGNLKYANHPS